MNSGLVLSRTGADDGRLSGRDLLGGGGMAQPASDGLQGHARVDELAGMRVAVDELSRQPGL
jgi:hypothetical protein